MPILLTASAALLALGMTLPAVETRTLLFWKDEYSILLNMRELGREGKQTAAAAIALFAVAYPLAKVAVLWFFWLAPFPYKWRFRFIRLLRMLGRWAMVDVLTIAAIVLGSLTIGPLEASPRSGLYLYSAGVITLMFAALLMDRLARYGR